MTPTKPPPRPPKFTGNERLLTPKVFDLPTRKLQHYSVPMIGEEPAWVDVLRRCDKPLDVIVIDFESYFDDEFHMARGAGDGLTTIEYVMDPRFEVLSCAFTPMSGLDPFADYEEKTFVQVTEEMVRTQLECYKRKYGENLERCVVVFQNGNFDALILSRRYGIHPPHVIDVLALSRHWHARSKHDLGTQAERYGLEEKGDTNEFKGQTFRKRYVIPKSRKKGPKLPIQRPIISPEMRAKLVAYNKNDNLREWELFTILLPKLSNPARELRLMQHTLELWTKPSLRIDFAKGEELVTLFEAEIDKALAAVTIWEYDGVSGYTGRPATREELSGNNSYEALLVDALKKAGDNPQVYFKPCVKGYKLADAKDDKERLLLLKHPDERVRQIMEARVAIKSWPLHISRVQRIMRMARADNGWLGVPLKYCGAHTGRWSGGEKINLQNLAKEGILALIRHMLIAPEGKVLVIVDAAAIEARVLAWIAGEWKLVDKFAANEEIYCGFAAKVLGWPVRKPKKGGIKSVEDKHKWARNAIGKIGILGCGYGMGAYEPGTRGTMNEMPNYLFDAAGLDIEMAVKIVATYRAEHTAITQFWRDIEKAFIYTAKYRRPCSLARGLRFDSAPDCDVVVTLPNGRELKYPTVKIVSGERGDKIEIYNSVEHKWEYSWGGALTENVVQAMSRDVLAETMLRLEDLGYHTVFHCHDEVVPCVDEADGPACLEAAIAEMSRVPEWAPRMPLGAEGCLSAHYKK